MAAHKNAATLGLDLEIALRTVPMVIRAPFGGGIHACAGMTLARLEARIAIGRFLERAPSFRLAKPPMRGGRARFRGFLSYPIVFSS